MIKLILKYLLYGIAWGALWFVMVCIIMDLFSPVTLQYMLQNFTLHALGSIAIGIACATTSIVYTLERLRRWQQVLIHATVGLGVYLPVAFGLGWLPAGSPLAILFSIGTSIIIFILIWSCFYLYHKHEAKAINKKLKERERNTK